MGRQRGQFYCGLIEELIAFVGALATELPAEPLSPQARRVWLWFCDISDSRPRNHVAEAVRKPDGKIATEIIRRPQALSFQEVEAWARLNRITLEPWELAALSMTDEAAMKSWNRPIDQVQTVKATKENIASMFDSMIETQKPKAKK